jgi:hypothetical protein
VIELGSDRRYNDQPEGAHQMNQKLSLNAILATLAALGATPMVACGSDKPAESPVAAQEINSADDNAPTTGVEPAPVIFEKTPSETEAADSTSEAGPAANEAVAPAQGAQTTVTEKPAPATAPEKKPTAKKKPGEGGCGAGGCG